jgi:phage terminase small subunit
MSAKGLTPKQAAFVREYLVDLNATQAAIRAGFSAKTAESQASRLLRNVKVGGAINLAVAKRAEKTELTAERVLKEIGLIAFRPLETEDTEEPDDDDDEYVRRVKEKLRSPDLRVADKLKALELLGKHLKLFTEKIEIKADESFAELLRQARERAQRR